MNLVNLQKPIVQNVMPTVLLAQQRETPKLLLAFANEPNIIKTTKANVKHARMAPIAVSKMELVCRNWWPSMGFGMFSLSIYLFNNVPHRLTFLIRVFSFPSYGTTTTTGAQPPTRPSSAIAAKAIPVQTKPWHWNVAAHTGNATTTTPKKKV